MTLNELKQYNPNLPVYTADSPEFAPYGRKIDGLDTTALDKTAKAIAMPREGSVYEPSTPCFEALPVFDELKTRLFGGMPTQLGYCYGYSSMLNALEWHACNEYNYAVTDFVLLLGLCSQLKDNTIDSSALKAFYIKAGESLEIYSGTLHFCPCMAEESGFGCVVGLLMGTNLPFDKPSGLPVLFKKNKYLICHVENKGLIERGVLPGVTGENTEIQLH